MHYDSVKEKKIIRLAKKSSWETLLSAAKIRNHGEILNTSRTLQDEELASSKHHITCRSACFEAHDEDRSNDELHKPHRKRNIASISCILPKCCLF